MSIKKEFRISSEDSARPQATINDEPRYFAQGLKAKPRVPVETLEGVLNEDGEVVRRTIYNDGVYMDTRLNPADYPNAKPVAPKPKAPKKASAGE